eukprot:CAMPEP_0174829130 /NCGR_PEP_ID=MMETSP1114-20130205/1753_1 /TAXON_ID=312471 /ORGANISM="Neobodo designis, Strain CCAP 1951/1" /LENGTH=78 /DNA_ID=CAMNT_0016062873 /DNA_START=323 /DNA_END=556 /DNA_ORIENTATION=-
MASADLEPLALDFFSLRRSLLMKQIGCSGSREFPPFQRAVVNASVPASPGPCKSGTNAHVAECAVYVAMGHRVHFLLI